MIELVGDQRARHRVAVRRLDVDLASNLANHGTYSESAAPPFQPYVRKPPGYPVLLAPFLAGRDLADGAAAAMKAQVLLGSLLPPLVVVLGGRIVPAPLAVVAGLLTAACPVLVTTPAFLTTEAVVPLVLVVSTWSRARRCTSTPLREDSSGPRS